VRIADDTAFFALPEGERGIFTGGGATVRVARIVGTDRMTEMMLTGRIVPASQALQLGLVHEVVAQGQALIRATELAQKIAKNAPASNHAIVTALPRIADMSASDGLFTEALVAAYVQATGEVNTRLNQFLQRKK
jgi:(methylthio)acryloyl-CoA hydratase